MERGGENRRVGNEGLEVYADRFYTRPSAGPAHAPDMRRILRVSDDGPALRPSRISGIGARTRGIAAEFEPELTGSFHAFP